jgi:hypothetical protein
VTLYLVQWHEPKTSSFKFYMTLTNCLNGIIKAHMGDVVSFTVSDPHARVSDFEVS